MADRLHRERVSSRARIAVQVTGLTFGLDGRNRSPGARVMGLRSVDLQTGGPISALRVVIRYLAATVLQELRYEVNDVMAGPPTARMRGLEPELRELEHQHMGDQAAQDQAAIDRFSDQHINLLTPWVRVGLSALAFAILPVLLSPRRQSLPDLLAGVVVVVDSPANTN
jgi:uncharacterized RDD family membrane protein YckC